MTTCVVEGCERDNRKGSKGLCGMHTQRLKRTGSLGPAEHVRDPEASIQDRIYPRLALNAETGCWEWQGARREGYGVVGDVQKVIYVHRFVYEHMVAEIPDGLVIDHLCANRACANPEHLEPVTRGINTRRGGQPHHEEAAA
jgi:hypothetical protein